jgi:hypothetical protein
MSSVCTADQDTTFSNSSTFNTWYNLTQTSINGITSTSSTTNIAAISDTLMKMSLCLEIKSNAVSGTANDISQTQEAILNLNEQILKEEENVAIAKDRVGYIRHPEENVSNYESWFPIDRPIHTLSLIIILSISLFVLIFLLLFLLSFLGIDIMLYRKPSMGSSYGTGIFYTVYSQFTPLTWAALIALIGVTVYYVKPK